MPNLQKEAAIWIFLKQGFLSVVADRDNPDRLLVRARVARHIQQVFPSADVFTDDSADYHYRSFISRQTAADTISDSVRRIDYDNFKDAVVSESMHTALMSVWVVMRNLQDKLLGRTNV